MELFSFKQLHGGNKQARRKGEKSALHERIEANFKAKDTQSRHETREKNEAL